MDQPLLLKIMFEEIPDNMIVLFKTTMILVNILIIITIVDIFLKLTINLARFIYVKFNLGYVELDSSVV